MGELNIFHALPSLLAFLINLGLGVFVYLKNLQNRVNSAFLLMSISIAVWNFQTFGLYIAPDETFAKIWLRIFGVGFCFIPPTSLLFVFSFTQAQSKVRRVLLIPVFLISIFFTILNLTGGLIKEVVKISWKYAPRGLMYNILLIFFFSALVGCVTELFRKYIRTTSYIKREQFKYLFLAALIGVTLGATNTLLSLGVKFYPLGNLGNIFYLGIIAYAIVRYRLLDITVVIKRGLLYTFSVGFITSSYITILSLSRLFFPSGIEWQVFLTILIAVFITATFQPLRNWFQRVTDSVFFKGRYDYQKTLREITQEINSVIGIRNLTNLVEQKITKEMRVAKTLFWVKEERGSGFSCKSNSGKEYFLSEECSIIRALMEKKEILEYDLIEYLLTYQTSSQAPPERAKLLSLKEEMAKLELRVILPLISRNQLLGCLGLGSKLSDDAFTYEDLELLKTLASEVAVGIENNLLYEKISQAEKLTTLGTMASGLVHELRNPLASIKTFVELLPRQKDNPAFLEKFNIFVPREIARLEELTQNLLNFARPSPPRFGKVNLNQLLVELLTFLESEFKKKEVELIQDLKGKVIIKGDQKQLSQAFMNILLNAIQASPYDGRQVIKVSSKLTPQYGEVSIQDRGKGISEKDLPHIFEPFYTRKERGTGLGLAITHRIIKAHGGEIEVRSQEKVGTTFYVKLPRDE
jgi:signal transduction histidine kinase